MSETLLPVITDAGLQACFNATNDGLKCEITHIALGDATYTPTSDMTALVNERQRVPVSDGNQVSPQQICVSGLVDGEDEYWVKEVGFILDDGTLLAVWSDDQPYSTLTYARIGTSDGTVTVADYLVGLQAGNYILTCTNADTPQSEVFSVTAPDSTDLGSATVGVEFANQAQFTIGVGSGDVANDWDVGDEIVIKVTLHRIIGYKAKDVDFAVRYDLLLTALPADSITVPATDAHLSMAVYSTEIVQLATGIIANQERHIDNWVTQIDLQNQINQLTI
jgi:hypothetical protein